jgi:pimeloyl-ACP methyl ester carboxylesterase
MSVSRSLGEPRRVQLREVGINYREVGSGEPIVFVHGVFVNGDLWRRVVPLLSGRYRCIAPDWPLGSHTEPTHPDADLSTIGMARLVTEFLAALDLENVTLVGNDTGGAVCQVASAENPERLARLVLTSCDAFEVYPPSPFGFLRVIPSIPGAAFLLAQSMRLRAIRRLPISYGWVMRAHPERAVEDGYTRPLLDARIRRDAKRMLKGISPDHTLRAAEALRGFDKPVLLAWAGDDRLFPFSLAERLADVLPNARLETVPDSLTFVAEDQPERLAQLIDDFISANPVA